MEYNNPSSPSESFNQCFCLILSFYSFIFILVRCLFALSVAHRYGDQADHRRSTAAATVPASRGLCQGH